MKHLLVAHCHYSIELESEESKIGPKSVALALNMYRIILKDQFLAVVSPTRVEPMVHASQLERHLVRLVAAQAPAHPVAASLQLKAQL